MGMVLEARVPNPQAAKRLFFAGFPKEGGQSVARLLFSPGPDCVGDAYVAAKKFFYRTGV